jgi:hypothetical protein
MEVRKYKPYMEHNISFEYDAHFAELHSHLSSQALGKGMRRPEMIFSKLRVQNFSSIKDTGVIPVTRLSLLLAR